MKGSCQHGNTSYVSIQKILDGCTIGGLSRWAPLHEIFYLRQTFDSVHFYHKSILQDEEKL
jgi:hypothetical protein